MAFWETMTVAQMNVLLGKKDEPGIKEGWDRLVEALGAERPGYKPADTVLSDCPLSPAVYFLFCVRESAQYQGDDLPKQVTVDLNDSNQLPEMRGSGNFQLMWYVYINASCSRSMTLYPADTPLGAVLDKIRMDNQKQWQQGSQNLMSDALEHLKRCLNGWDGACRAMWDAAQPKQAPQETALDAFPELSPLGPEDPDDQARWEREAMRTELCKQNPTFAQLDGLVANGVKQIILTGAPGTGKTYSAGLAAQYLGDPLDNAEGEAPYPLVQFHPSYDYTDFVEGLRPVQLEGKGEDSVSFVKVDGSFKAFCRRVAEANQARAQSPKNDPDRRYFFLIDEINRADLSKVFGELLFCLEADKRGKPVETQYHNLPTYTPNKASGRFVSLEDDIFAKGFFIPENIVIIGTMNDIDRSVESMDFALRRRFEFREVEVTGELLSKAFQDDSFPTALESPLQEKGKVGPETAAGRILALNRVISGTERNQGGQLGLDRHYHISQGQFAHLPLDKNVSLNDLMQYVWDYRVKFLLEEYLRGFTQKEVDGFLSACAAALGVKAQADDKPGSEDSEKPDPNAPENSSDE